MIRSLALLIFLLAASTAAFARAQDAGQPFMAAAESYRNQQWQAAADGFARLLAQQPDFSRAADAHFFCGEALAQLGQWQQARPHFLEVLRLAPQGEHARQSLFRAGEASLMAGDLPSAARDLATFSQRYADDKLNSFALVYLGDLELQSARADAALARYREALAKFPDGPLAAEALFGVAQSQHQSGQLEQARETYRQVLERGGEIVEPALLQLGVTENALGEHQSALGALQQFAKSFPASPLSDKAELGRGYALYKLDRFDESQAALAPLTSKPGVQIDASYLLGLAQGGKGDWKAAAQTLQNIHLDPNHSLAEAVAYHTADALLESGQVDAAAARLDEFLQQFPTSDWVDDSLLAKTRIAIERKDAAASLELADELLSKFADSPLAEQARLAKGQALLALDKPQEAIAAVQSLASDTRLDDPALEELRNRALSTLAVSEAKLGNFEQAKQAVESIAKDSAAQDLIGQVKYHVGELAQAAGKQDVAQEFLAGVTQQAGALAERARTSLGWNHFEAGRWDEAAAAFEQVLASGATGEQAAEASLLRGRALEHLQKLDDALASYDRVIAEYSDTSRAAEAQYHAAALLEQQGQVDAALKRYQSLLEEHADFPQLDDVLTRAAILLKQTDPAASAKLLERLRSDFAASPHSAEATLRLAEQAVESGEFATAEPLLREVTRPDASPDVRPRALYLSGRMELSRGDNAAAERSLNQLITEHADSDLAPVAEYLLGEVYFREGKFDQVAEKLGALSDKMKDRNDAWLATSELRRAQALAQLRRWDDSTAVAQAIGSRFPDFAEKYEVDYLLGRAAAAGANFDAARQSYAAVLAAPAAAGTETAAMAQWMIGESHFHQQQYAQALDEYLKVDPQQARWHAAALLQAGKCQENLGRWQDAAATYGQLVERYPDGQLAAEATRRRDVARQQAASGSPAPAARK